MKIIISMIPLRLESVVLGPGTRPLAARDRAPPRGVRMVSFLIMSRVTAPGAADALINYWIILLEAGQA